MQIQWSDRLNRITISPTEQTPSNLIFLHLFFSFRSVEICILINTIPYIVGERKVCLFSIKSRIVFANEWKNKIQSWFQKITHNTRRPEDSWYVEMYRNSCNTLSISHPPTATRFRFHQTTIPIWHRASIFEAKTIWRTSNIFSLNQIHLILYNERHPFFHLILFLSELHYFIQCLYRFTNLHKLKFKKINKQTKHKSFKVCNHLVCNYIVWKTIIIELKLSERVESSCEYNVKNR